MDRHPAMRQMLGWRILRAWAITEPTDLHPPCPLRLLQAMVVSTLAWGWWETTAVLLLGFFALLRPLEYLSATWGDLALPSSHSAGQVIFVAIPQHKSQRRGPRRTHVRLDEPLVVKFLTHQATGRQPFEPIWSGSANTWRRRVRTLSRHFTGRENTVMPSSLRPGVASHFFEVWGENVPKLMCPEVPRS